VQWDPERTIQGNRLPYCSIQVGLGPQIVGKYVNEWTLEIRDCTPLVRNLYAQIQSGQIAVAEALLPTKRPYPVDEAIAMRLAML
jgi:hypothetical protein